MTRQKSLTIHQDNWALNAFHCLIAKGLICQNIPTGQKNESGPAASNGLLNLSYYLTKWAHGKWLTAEKCHSHIMNSINWNRDLCLKNGSGPEIWNLWKIKTFCPIIMTKFIKNGAKTGDFLCFLCQFHFLCISLYNGINQTHYLELVELKLVCILRTIIQMLFFCF